jgi:hypothetical protein
VSRPDSRPDALQRRRLLLLGGDGAQGSPGNVQIVGIILLAATALIGNLALWAIERRLDKPHPTNRKEKP